MTIYDIIKERGFKSSFGGNYLNPDSYEGVETVIFTTEENADRLRGYPMGESTYIIVSHNRDESLRKFNHVRDMVSILFCMSKVTFFRGDTKIRIEKFKAKK